MSDFIYEANLIEPGLWMVKRWKLGASPNDYTEALIRVDTTDAEAAKQAAIARNSWA